MNCPVSQLLRRLHHILDKQWCYVAPDGSVRTAEEPYVGVMAIHYPNLCLEMVDTRCWIPFSSSGYHWKTDTCILSTLPMHLHHKNRNKHLHALYLCIVYSLSLMTQELPMNMITEHKLSASYWVYTVNGKVHCFSRSRHTLWNGQLTV